MSCSNDIESLTSSENSSTVSIEKVKNFNSHITPPEDAMKVFVSEFVTGVNDLVKANKDKITLLCEQLKRKHRILPSKMDIRSTYEKHFADVNVPLIFKNWMIKRYVRSNSGVLVVTITLSPHKFSCKYDCFYCPQETDLNGKHTQPRSYLSSEPAMMRALASRDGDSYDFDVKKQFQNRVQTYIYTGSIKEGATGSYKMEIILSGGTWESYPIEYREKVINELYWSANTLNSDRAIRSLEEEIAENETSMFRIVGLTLETRPDNITPESIRDYCRWGCTRVQIGVQHFDDAILKKINRRCYTKDTIRAIRLLKQCGFKVVVHLMPDLPGSSPELDTWMFTQAIYNPDLQFDDVKIYPTAVCKSSDPNLIVKSKIADWYRDGLFMPYAEVDLQQLIDVLGYYKKNVQPWIRIQRLIRDIPGKSIESGYNKISNLRQILQQKLGPVCKCIYCMEIGDKELDNLEPILVVRRYVASEGYEYFISFEAHAMNIWQKASYYLWFCWAFIYWLFTGDRIYWSGDIASYSGLFGFCRLRFDDNPGSDIVPEINGCALIREVHVYGFSLGVGDDSVGSQHRGFGKLLVKTAEEISAMNGFRRSAVIAGVGTREYYKNKCGYTKGQTYMLKNLTEYDGNDLLRAAAFGLVGFVITFLARNNG